MPTIDNVQKAELWKLDPANPTVAQTRFKVQFNPDTLRVTYNNQVQPPSQTPPDQQHGTASTQFVGRGTSKLAVTLWFDVTAELPEGVEVPNNDVRDLTDKIVDLIKNDPNSDPPAPPAVRFIWGSFQFDGLIESIDQSLEFFSSEGIPLRASMGLSMTRQSVDYAYPENRPQGAARRPSADGAPRGASPGTKPLVAAPSGSTLMGIASALGKVDKLHEIAEAHGFETLRQLPPGQMIDMNVPLPGRTLF